MDQATWQAEKHYLAQVIDHIHSALAQAQAEYEQAHHETSAVEANYGANTSINTLEVDDAMETNAEIQQQRNIVARVTQTEAITQKHLQTLTTLLHNPYFGRVDIVEDGVPETLYIGTASLQDDQGNFLVNDWRAPISGVYYNGALGPATYQTPNGQQSVTLVKKRQFTIADQKLKNMFDTDVTIGDEMLQHVLGQQGDEKMHNIVSTIQQEQNQIIRDTSSDLLVVQGVAGSGKTSAVLQRIAFLLFHARETLNADQIVLFSPNRLYSSYIADVLPSLGERNMRQVTFAEFLTARLQGLQVQTLFERYEQNAVAGQASRTIQKALEDDQILTAMHEYLEQLSPQEIALRDIRLRGQAWFSATEMREYLQTLPSAYPLVDRMQMMQKDFLERLARQIEHSGELDFVAEDMQGLSESDYQSLLRDEEGQVVIDLDSDPQLGERKIEQRYLELKLRPIDDALYNFSMLDIYVQYGDFLAYLADRTYAGLNRDLWLAKRERFLHELEFHRLDYEDATLILFLRDYMTGAGTNQHMQYICVDEMQDYSLVQLKYLQHAFPKAKFTLLGDSQQALYGQAQQPEALLKRYQVTFSNQRQRLIKLNKSYRSTKEIMAFASAVAPAEDEIETFERSGKKPIVRVMKPNQAAAQLHHFVEDLHQRQKTVAILTQTQASAKAVAQLLEQTGDSYQLIDDQARSRQAKTLVMPIYLAKGLEFDAVIGYDVSQTSYGATSSAGVLYTLASRALHELVLMTIGDVPATLTQAKQWVDWQDVRA